ncbi:MAG: UbiA family prenyltransferase [Dehalococcoidales bacterium]|nr:UbiA family prenyltransferase [Dehalococcoidales bacterium]
MMKIITNIQSSASQLDLSFGDRVGGFVSLIRPVFFVLTPVNAAAAVVLALGGFPAPAKCVFGFLAVAFASCAVNVFNDYVDRERDKTVWPHRPIPGGRVKSNEALLVAIVSLTVSLTITWFAFNPATFYILLLAMVLGGLYSVYLRDRIGYLSLPPIVGLIYLGGWAAFSPGTLFTSWLPWYLYLIGVVWQTAHIMIYYPLHVVPGRENPRALIFRPSARTAVITGIVFTVLTILSGGLLPLAASDLGVLYVVLVIAAGIYALVSGFKFYKDTKERKRGVAAFTALSVFRLVISAAILISILVT